MRLMESTPDATPALVLTTAFMAAVLIGDITRPMPRPIRMKAGRRNRYDVWVVMNDCQNSALEASSRPATIGMRGPMRSARRPEIGPMKMMITVEGRKRTPA